MERKKLTLYLFGLIYAIILGSLVYIAPEKKELWFFLEIITLPSIYMIGYEILMHKQKRGFGKDTHKIMEEVNKLKNYADILISENQKLKEENNYIKEEIKKRK